MEKNRLDAPCCDRNTVIKGYSIRRPKTAAWVRVTALSFERRARSLMGTGVIKDIKQDRSTWYNGARKKRKKLESIDQYA